MDVVLIGYRGSGKTTIGKKLADRLWTKFTDLDDLVVAKAGKTIKAIFEEDGEERFRDLETQCLREALGGEGVLALGGGTLVRESNRRLVKESGVKAIYLKCDPKTLHARIHADARTAETRPALTDLGGSLEEVHALLEVREPLYREVKTSELDVTNLSVDEALVYIARMM